MRWLIQFVARTLQSAGRHLGGAVPEHLRTARRGEMEAYLFLRSQGYRLVATNLRVPQSGGEIDLVGWDDGILCFIEVKTRTAEGLAPPEAAVDRAKKGHILAVARRYVRRLPGKHPPPCRFDVVSIVLGGHDAAPKIRLQKGAFEWEADRRWRRAASHQWSRSHWRDRR